MRRLIWPILMTATLSFGAAGSQRDSAAANVKVTCRIWPRSSLLQNEVAPIVRVSLDNGSPDTVTITAMAGHLQIKNVSGQRSLLKRDRSYWSPIDVEKKSALKPVHDSKGVWTYPDGRLVLKPGQPIEFSIDLSVLEWNDQLASTLPTAKLYAMVPDGSYELYFDLEAYDKLGKFSVESSKATVEIQRPATKTP